MNLGNMRGNGVRSLAVHWWNCQHVSVLNVDSYGDEVEVPSFGPRMRCTNCGKLGTDARPNWKERPERESLTGTL
jgi:hypothetical protein